MGTPRSTRSSSKKSSSFLLPEEIDNLSALLEIPEPPHNPDPQNTGAIPKKKPSNETLDMNIFYDYHTHIVTAVRVFLASR